jgi:hypothetical protein
MMVTQDDALVIDKVLQQVFYVEEKADKNKGFNHPKPKPMKVLVVEPGKIELLAVISQFLYQTGNTGWRLLRGQNLFIFAKRVSVRGRLNSLSHITKDVLVSWNDRQVPHPGLPADRGNLSSPPGI